MAKKPAAKKPNTRGRKKGQQTHIPGVGPEKNEAIHELAVDYVRARDARMDMLKQEVELKGRLTDAMHSEKLKAYEFDDIAVSLTSKEDLKVKKAGRDAEEE